MAVSSVRDCIRALSSQFKGFRKTIVSGEWHVFQNRKNLNTEQCDMRGARRIDIFPKLRGAGGLLKTVAGVALAVVGVVTGQTWLINVGVGLALGGVAEMLAPAPPSPNFGGRQNASANQSNYFDGAVNRSAVGLPVPVIYGQMRVGSIEVSTSINVE